MLAVCFALALGSVPSPDFGSFAHSTQTSTAATPAIRRPTPIVIGRAELGPDAPGHTYVVDASGGGDFLDLPPAIAASQAGDVLSVKPGRYSAFVLDKGIVIVGATDVVVAGPSSIAGISAPEIAAVVGMKLDSLSVLNSSGTIVVQELEPPAILTVDHCGDVRLRRIVNTWWLFDSRAGMTAIASRVEVAASELQGAMSAEVDGVGGAGIDAMSGSRVHLVESNVFGGRGYEVYECCGAHGPSGGPGIRVEARSALIAVGPGSFAKGGDGGWNLWYDNCSHDGAGGYAVEGAGALLHSDLRVHGGYYDVSFDCDNVSFAPSYHHLLTEIELAPRFPELSLTGAPHVGAELALHLRGEPFAPVGLWVGKPAIHLATPGFPIEQLVTHDHHVPLGTLDAHGELGTTFTLDASLPFGSLVGLQAEVLASGSRQRTNSVPIVVR